MDILLRRPHSRLSPFVSHYWVSNDNAAGSHAVIPDGCVDVVLEMYRGHCSSWLFGSTTASVNVPLDTGAHYLGIRFRPGQARHFVACPARHLTDTQVSTHGLIDFPTQKVADALFSGKVVAELDRLLIAWLSHHPPSISVVDQAMQYIERHPGTPRAGGLAAASGLSRRQMERVFLETVGVSPKTFLMIRRCHDALRGLAAPSGHSLAAIAADAGYADQSHMNRDFRQLLGRSPGSLRNVAFVQDGSP